MAECTVDLVWGWPQPCWRFESVSQWRKSEDTDSADLLNVQVKVLMFIFFKFVLKPSDKQPSQFFWDLKLATYPLISGTGCVVWLLEGLSLILFVMRCTKLFLANRVLLSDASDDYKGGSGVWELLDTVPVGYWSSLKYCLNLMHSSRRCVNMGTIVLFQSRKNEENVERVKN